MPDVRCLLTEDEIAAAVDNLGAQLSQDFANRHLTILGVLTGSLVFVSDLMRKLTVPHQLGLIQASSYRGETTVAGELRINLDFLPEIRGRNILLIDDIFDTGRTLTGIIQQLQEFEPATLHSAVLLWKRSRTEVDTSPDYYCFEIPDKFVVGYGLDYNGEYRNLRFLGMIENSTSD